MDSCTDNGARDESLHRNVADGPQNTVDLLVGWSPELRAPLSAIIALVQVLRVGSGTEHNHALVDSCLGDIGHCATHLAGLIDQILAVAQAEHPATSALSAR